jgi:hypothetical protein
LPNIHFTFTFTSAVPGQIHATSLCAEVAHLSGASEYVGTIFGKTEDMKVLASDGSSGKAFWYALGK